MVIQIALLVASQPHPLVAVTLMIPPPAPGFLKLWLAGEIEYEQATPAPSCTTVKVWPAMVSVPVRGPSLMFSLTSNVILALPVALVAEVIMIQPSLLVAVQLQAGPAVTAVDPSPPAAVNG